MTVTFSKPIYQLVIYSGGGGFTCSGTYGTVTAYDRTHFGVGGWQVEQRDFVLEFPEDCGYDQATCCGVDTLRFPGGIAKLLIDPPQPWEYPVPTSDTTPPDWGYMQTTYYYYLYEERPPTAPCPTEDELLDQQAMRDFLLDAWTYSNPSAPPPNRREVRGWLFEDSTGTLLHQLYPNPAYDTPCRSNGAPVGGALPGVPVALGHPHPFAPGDTIFPPTCGFTTPRRYTTEQYGGPSVDDILTLADDSLPGYIVDSVNIYVVPVGTDTLNALSKVKPYPRVDPVSGCTRL